METESGRFFSTQFMRCRWATGVLWAVFTTCYAILTAVVFLEDQWIGDTEESHSPGNFGLWRWCTDRDGDDLCHGSLNDFSSLLSPANRAATVFTGLSVVTAVLTVLAFLLFTMCSSADVFKICGSLQLCSGVFLGVGIFSFPAGWDSPKVQGVCGDQATDYSLGTCGFRWAYLLAIIALVDSVLLGSLALTLASRQLGVTENTYASIYKGEINPGFLGDNQSLGGGRKAGAPLHPVMLLPQVQGEDRYGDFSPRARESQSPFRGRQREANFQL